MSADEATHAGGFAFETIPNAVEARAISRLIASDPQLVERKCWLSLQCRDACTLADGTPLAPLGQELCAALSRRTAFTGLGTNCVPPDIAERIISTLVAAVVAQRTAPAAAAAAAVDKPAAAAATAATTTVAAAAAAKDKNQIAAAAADIPAAAAAAAAAAAVAVAGQGERGATQRGVNAICVYPNDGGTWDAGARCWHARTAPSMAITHARRWQEMIASAGLCAIVGGCCSTDEALVRELRSSLDQWF
mmetsp:Transcript_42399/g.99528  ORF Transcript_42399/g.99528 Transcript_42399/m.99528 type:complete len:249 (-) Transcript_42399:89-835(-)